MILVVVITFITVTALISHRANSNNVYVSSSYNNVLIQTTTPSAAGYMFDDYYNVNIKIKEKNR